MNTSLSGLAVTDETGNTLYSYFETNMISGAVVVNSC